MAETSYQLPDLPYDYNELEPVISAEALKLHHDKHHRGYVKNLNTALDQYHEAERKKDLDKMVALQSAIEFNGGGHINHSFFWNCLKPQKKGGGEPPKGTLLKAIKEDFTSFDHFAEVFSKASVGVQGSGWGWLAFNKETKNLEIATTANHGTLTNKGLVPILVVDVWEHAYYLQYKNMRPDFVKAIWSVLDWGTIEKRYNSLTS